MIRLIKQRSINRTKVELKQITDRIWWFITISINRTKVELKQYTILLFLYFLTYQSYQSGIETCPCTSCWSISPWSINRTKVELKHTHIRRPLLRVKLSIVPKWNWNKQKSAFSRLWAKLSIVPKWNWNRTQYGKHCYAGTINRTKVELKQDLVALLTDEYGYQSYQSGIETAFANFCASYYILSIVPKWNWNNCIRKRL